MISPFLKSQDQSGFTLLELMVALGLTALLTLVAFTALNLTLKAVGRGQNAAEAPKLIVY